MILINGNFLFEKDSTTLTGQNSFAYELCKRLDAIIDFRDDISILVPANTTVYPAFKRIKIIMSDKEIKKTENWDWGIFKNACNKFNAVALNLLARAPKGSKCGFSFVHDFYELDYADIFSTNSERKEQLYAKNNLLNITKNAKGIFTCSQAIKNTLNKVYLVPNEKITVLPGGWQKSQSEFEYSKKAQDELSEDAPTQTNGEPTESEPVTDDIFEKFPILKEKTFYFANANLQKRHNLLWILKYAELHPDDFFALQGLSQEDELSDEFSKLKNLSNILLLGKLSEHEKFSLLQKSRAFVNPTFTEGFSMENALALKAGTQIVISNNSATFSIFNETAHYIDPKNPQCELDQVLLDPITSPENFLARNTFEESAQKLYETLKNTVL